jgi:hypothetical protein|tara:strand:+ start:488 stop:679 length:192 start_codon:yes stop_codon:yes gene_type:complete
MSNEYNDIIKDHIESKVVNANFSAEDLLAELGMKYQDAYENKLSYDELINLVIEKRFEEFAEV